MSTNNVFRNLLIISCAADKLREEILPLIMDEHGELDFTGLSPVPEIYTNGVYWYDGSQHHINLPDYENLRTTTCREMMEGDDYTHLKSGKALKRLLNQCRNSDKFLDTGIIDYFLKEITDETGESEAPALLRAIVNLVEEINKDWCEHQYGSTTEEGYCLSLFGSQPYSINKQVSVSYLETTNEHVIHFLTSRREDQDAIHDYKWLQMLDERYAGMSIRLLSQQLPQRHNRPAKLVVPSRALNANALFTGDRNAPAILSDVPEATVDHYIMAFDETPIKPTVDDINYYQIPQYQRQLSILQPLKSADYWFITASPESNLKNLISQLKVHYEEVNELTVALQKLLKATGVDCIDALFTAEHINNEELHELWVEVVDAFGDQIVTSTGSLRYLGTDPSRVMSSITASNLSKFEDGKPVREVEGGKIMKSKKNYSKVILDFAVLDMRYHMRKWVYNPETSSNLQLTDLTKEGMK